MPFTFKLSKRLARMKGALALLAALVACERGTVVGPPLPGALLQPVVVPDTVTLEPSQTHQFHAYGRTQAGDSVPITVAWSAQVGAMSSSGLHTAADFDGDYQVAAVLVSPSTGQPPANGGAIVHVRRTSFLTQVVVVPASPTVVTGGTQQFAAYGRPDTGDSVPVGVTWSATTGAISPSGLYTAGPAPGGDIVIARASGTTGTAIVAVSNISVASVAVSPASASVSVGSTQQLSAVMKDVNGNVLTGRMVTWASSDGAVATVSASGLVTGVAAGPATITATSEGKSASAAITVANVPVASVVISPATAAVFVGATVQLAATLLDSAGNVLSGRAVTWASSAPAVATVSASGLVTGVAPGAVTITGTSEGRSGSAAVAVSNVPVASVAVSPASASVSIGATHQLSAVVKDANGNVLTGRTVTWATSSSAVATVSSGGLVTGVATGTATITATSEGQSGSASLTVTDLPVASVTISPPAPSAYVGGSVQLTATPKDANENPLSGRTVTWTTSNGSIATVSVSGLVTALAVGSATITATSEGQSGSVVVTVSSIPVASVVVSPASANVLVGGTAQLSATPKDAAGNVLTGRTVTWASSAPGVATVSTGGLVTGVAPGSATITATSEGKSASAAITVANVPVASVVISPATAAVSLGATVQLAATLLDSAGNLLSGRAVTWASSAPAVATVSASGLVTGVAPGAVTITAASEGKAGSAAVTVNPVPVASVTVTPTTAAILVGQTVQLMATPRDANGNVLSGRAVTWGSSAPAVATVSASGLVSGVAAGAATITATSEGKSASAAISVAQVPVASVVISPVTAAVFVGATVQLAATLLDSAGTVLAGRAVTWASSAPAVAMVSASGLVTGVAPGAVTVTATSEGKTGSAAVTVNPVPVASVSVSPASASIEVGQTVQLTATLLDANGNPLSSRLITWASSAPAVATVSSSGLVTGVAAGAATITATSEGKSASAAITVPAPPSGPVYYVSSTGNDAVSCAQAQNIGTPKRTLNNAVKCLTPGTTLLIRGGTYAESLINNIPWGTSWATPVTLKAYPGEPVTIRPTGGSHVFHFQDGQSYIVLEGLVIDAVNVSTGGVKITRSTSAAHHIRLKDCEIKNAPSQGVLVTGPNTSHNEFINLNVHHNGGPVGGNNLTHGIYIEGPNNLVDGGDFWSNSSYGIHVYSDNGGANNNVVRNCRSHGNNKAAVFGSGDGNVVYNCLFYGNAAEGPKVSHNGTNTKFYNNTIYNNGSGFQVASGCSGTIVRNNLVWQSGTAYSNSGTGTVADHNLWGTSNPLFVDAAAGDFHVQSGSPAIDAGTTILMVPTDLDGVTRPLGIAYDIGAFEYRSGR